MKGNNQKNDHQSWVDKHPGGEQKSALERTRGFCLVDCSDASPFCAHLQGVFLCVVFVEASATMLHWTLLSLSDVVQWSI